jgi:flagellar biosynthesis protein FlhG
VPPKSKARPRVVAVAGGKGGVGKSTVAVNIATAIGRLGHRVAIVDSDFGAANLHTMMGVLHPSVTIADFIDHKAETLEDVAIQVSPTVSLVAGTSRPGAANMSSQARLRLIRAIARLEADCVIVDVGAGTAFGVVDQVIAADVKLMVVNPNLPSLHNAYALLKACVHRICRRMASDETQQDLIDAALGQETKARTIPQLLAVLRPLDPTFADKIADTLQRFGGMLVANQLANDREKGAVERMAPLIYDHLLLYTPVTGTIPRTAGLAGGLRAGANTTLERTDESSPAIRRLAGSVLDADLARLRGETRQAPQAGTVPIWVQRDLAS